MTGASAEMPVREHSPGRPTIEVLGDEDIVVQLRIRSEHASDLLRLTVPELLVGIQTPGSCEQTLTTQHLVNAGDATGEAVGRVEDRRVRIRQRRADSKQIDSRGRA